MTQKMTFDALTVTYGAEENDWKFKINHSTEYLTDEEMRDLIQWSMKIMLDLALEAANADE